MSTYSVESYFNIVLIIRVMVDLLMTNGDFNVGAYYGTVGPR